jgi:tetratricopeptide (TPR) repeat protein
VTDDVIDDGVDDLDGPDDADVPIEDVIGYLFGQLVDPDDETDVDDTRAELGIAFVEVGERDQSGSDLSSAIEYLGTAIEAAPHHGNRDRWLFFLGVAYADRAELTGSTTDADDGIRWLRMAFATTGGRPDAVMVLALLAVQLWQKYWRLAHQEPVDEAEARRWLDEILTEMDGWPAMPGADPGLARAVDLYRGITHLERHDRRQQRSDLDAGIALLARSVPHFDVAVDCFGYAAAQLVWAYTNRAELDDDPADLDAGIALGSAARERIEYGVFDWVLLTENLGSAYAERWDWRHEPGDLDRAIAHFQESLRTAEMPVSTGMLGARLRERADLNQSRDDADEAIRVLEQALREEPGEEYEWIVHLDLGMAHRLRFALTDDVLALEAAFDRLDRAMDLAPDDEFDLTGLVHLERVYAGIDSVSEEKLHDRDLIRANAPRQRVILEAAHRWLESYGGDDPEFGATMAGVLGMAELFLFSVDLVEPNIGRIERMTEQARRMPDPDPDWLAIVALCDSQLEMWHEARSGRGDGDAGVTPLREALSTEASTGPLGDHLRRTMKMLVRMRAVRSWDRRSVKAGLRSTDPTGALSAEDPVLVLMAETADALQGNDIDAVNRLAIGAAELLRKDPDDTTVLILKPLFDMARIQSGRPIDEDLARVFDQRLGRINEESGSYLRTLAGYSAAAMAAVRLAQAESSMDAEMIRTIAWELEGRARHAPADQSAATMIGNALAAMGLHLLWRAEPVDAQLKEIAIHRHETALELMGGPGHDLWAATAMDLATLLRLGGTADDRRARDLGKSAIASDAFRVATQSGADFAIQAAARVAPHVHLVAHWCVTDRAYDDLIAVLDAGRGLALRASAMSRDVAAALDRKGEYELAGKWRASRGLGTDLLTGLVLRMIPSGDELPDDTRQRALRTLGIEALPAETRIADVQDALVTAGADAFVYLLPGTAPFNGYAVIVPATGAVRVLPLPRLQTDPQTVVGRYAGASHPGTTRTVDRDIDSVGHDDGRPSLDDLCRWAWDVAINDVVRETSGWRLGRPARLVLAPMGVLALVPWHAAYAVVGGDRRSYAINELVISYAVSARLFCDRAGHPLSRPSASLIVGDPTGGLAFAAAEAKAIHRAFYEPIGDYFGRPAGEAAADGTPEQVLDWIAAHAGGPATLHFACHGWIDRAAAAGAHLLLADRKTLTARDILDACSDEDVQLDRVILAACTTNTVGAEYDEAFSLASVFMSVGAHTVYGSLWPVPDAETSLLMFMVHHLLVAESLQPVDALHRAQLWMLDPDRLPPETMPDEFKAAARNAGACEPIAWAGFTHMGR